MGTIAALKKCLEAEEVTREPIHHGLDIWWSYPRGKRISVDWAPVSKATGTRQQGEVPTNAMGNRIRPYEIGSKGTGRDLEVVCRVAPATETRLGVWIEDG